MADLEKMTAQYVDEGYSEPFPEELRMCSIFAIYRNL